MLCDFMTPIEVKKKNQNKFKSLPHKNYLGKIFSCLLSGQTFRVIVKIFALSYPQRV